MNRTDLVSVTLLLTILAASVAAAGDDTELFTQVLTARPTAATTRPSSETIKRDLETWDPAAQPAQVGELMQHILMQEEPARTALLRQLESRTSEQAAAAQASGHSPTALPVPPANHAPTPPPPPTVEELRFWVTRLPVGPGISVEEQLVVDDFVGKISAVEDPIAREELLALLRSREAAATATAKGTTDEPTP